MGFKNIAKRTGTAVATGGLSEVVRYADKEDLGTKTTEKWQGLTDAIGVTDYAATEEAAATAATATIAATELSQAQLDFQMQQYEDWKGVYGDLQTEMGDYYKNITGDALASRQVSQLQEQSQLAQKQMDEQLAQRGLSGSGLEAAALQQNLFSTAQQKANILASSDQLAMEQKAGFLGLGLGQGSQMLGNIANVSNVGVSTQGNIAASAMGSATQQQIANQNTMGQLWGTAAGLTLS